MGILSLKFILLRYGLAVLFTTAAVLIRQSDDFYFIAVAAIVSLPLLTYDGITYAVHRKWPAFHIRPWLLIGYIIALGVNILSAWASASGETDAGFSLFATVIITPWLLGASLVIMGIHGAIVSRHRR